MKKLEFEYTIKKIPYYDNTKKASLHVRIKNFEEDMICKEVALFRGSSHEAIIKIKDDEHFDIVIIHGLEGVDNPTKTNLNFKDLNKNYYTCYLIDSRNDIEMLKVGLSL